MIKKKLFGNDRKHMKNIWRKMTIGIKKRIIHYNM